MLFSAGSLLSPQVNTAVNGYLSFVCPVFSEDLQQFFPMLRKNILKKAVRMERKDGDVSFNEVKSSLIMI